LLTLKGSSPRTTRPNNCNVIPPSKHVTPVQFMWAFYDKDGKVISALGGSYTLKGDAYEEVPEYGVGEELLEALKGKPQSFKWKIGANKWRHTGKLSTWQPIEEVWELVQKSNGSCERVPVLAFVNNHFAGYAPDTIRQLLAALGATAE
jgi:hypothetical protein